MALTSVTTLILNPLSVTSICITSSLFQRWQTISPNFETRDLDIQVVVNTLEGNSSTRKDKKTVSSFFQSLYLGQSDNLLRIMKNRLPELGLVREDCQELSWIQSAPFFSGFPIGTPPEILLNRSASARYAYKGKSSFVQKPISEDKSNGAWERRLQLPSPFLKGVHVFRRLLSQ